MKPTFLVVGADGLIGSTLVAHGRNSGHTVSSTLLGLAGPSEGSMAFDMTVEPWPALPQCSAAVICAAITSQDQCRREPARTRDLNVVRTLRLARMLNERGTFVVFISSNQVFDGTRPLRRSNEPVSPKTEYGRQKAETESGLMQLEHFGIVRLSKVFTPTLGIIETWRRKLRNCETIQPFSDYICSPVSLEIVTRAIWAVLESRKKGIWHVSARQDFSYADIAVRLCGAMGADPALVQPITSPPGVLEHIPQYSTLESSELEQCFGIEIPSAADTLQRVLS